MAPTPRRQRTLQEELQADYVNERHIEAFEQALNTDELYEPELPETPSSGSTIFHSTTRVPGTPASGSSLHLTNMSSGSNANGSVQSMSSLHSGSQRIRKVSALSDFAPVNLRVAKKRHKGRKGSADMERRQEWLYLLVRWPLLCLILLFVCLEFGFYVFIRQCVNAKEWITAWRGKKGAMRKRLRVAKTYDEWKETALALDSYLKFDEWKFIDEDTLYDWRLVRKVLKSLKTLRAKDDARGLLGILETCLRTNFAGIESARLYSETFYGTKNLLESYITEIEKCLIHIRESTILSVEEKRRFFKSTNTNLGVSALCLSGGASFGYYHFGVLKAFVEAKLLPRVITGTSAGALIAALACTRTDSELSRILVPDLADKITACEDSFKVWWQRFRKTGARFDSVQWAKKANFFTRGSMTFREAYLRTGRILNVSVIPADRHSPTKLLNYMTAPNTVIWSALLASAAVPGILNPVVLMQKTKDGGIVPWNWGSKFKDGSLRVDIPLQALNLYFNVTHPIVSQVNPHVHLFFFAPRGSAGKPVAHRKGKGWRGNFLLSAAEQWLKLELTKNFKLIRDLELLPQILGQDWSSVFLQRFEGTVTIWPKTRFKDWLHILSDPDREELQRMMLVGQAVTWPKLHMIENRFRIEREIFRGRQAVRKNQDRSTPLPTTSNSISTQQHQQPLAVVTNMSSKSTSVPSISVSDDGGAASEAALLADTETEAGEMDGQTLARKEKSSSGSQGGSGQSTPKELKSCEDPLRSPARRRKWASEIFEDEDTRSGDLIRESKMRTPDPPLDKDSNIAISGVSYPETSVTTSGFTVQNTESPTTPRVEAPGFLARLRSSASLHKFASSTFPTWGRMGSSSATVNQDAWSSDSSSDDEPEDLPLHQSGFSRPHSFYGSPHDLMQQHSAYTSGFTADGPALWGADRFEET